MKKTTTRVAEDVAVPAGAGIKPPSRRICIIGPSNSGKSTLAARLGEKRGLPVFHLDQISHMPGTHWTRRPDAAFVADHDKIIAGESWIIDGNYSLCMPQRFARATAVVWLDPPLWGCVCRYILRSLKDRKDRPGRLDGAKSEFSIGLITFTLFNYPKNRKKYERLLAGSGTPLLRVRSMGELNALCREWGLAT